MGKLDYGTNRLVNRRVITLNDKDEFCEHIRCNEKAMYSLALSIVRNSSDAGEVVSEAIYRAYKNLDTLKNDNSFKTWILSIVHNTAVGMIRKNSRVIPAEEIYETQSESGENEIITNITLREAVNSLKQPYRTVVVLYYYENLSVLKISQITGATSVAVKKQLSRARKMLREILKEDFGE